MAIAPIVQALQGQPQLNGAMQALFAPPPVAQPIPQIPQQQPTQVAALGLPPLEDVHAMEMNRIFVDAARRAIENARRGSQQGQQGK